MQPTSDKIKTFIGDNFVLLQKRFRATDGCHLNKLGMSRYDLFMEGILECLEKPCETEDVEIFICCTIRRALHRMAMREYREPEKCELEEAKLAELIKHFN